MEGKQTLGGAVSSFERQFKKFQDSGNKPPEFLLPKKRAAAPPILEVGVRDYLFLSVSME